MNRRLPTTRLDRVELLNALARRCAELSRGLESAAALVHDRQLESILAANARELEGFVKRLQALVLLRGGRPIDESRAGRIIARGLMKLRAALPGSDRAIIDKCDDIERVAERAYTRALELDLDDDERAALEQQRSELHRMHRYLDERLGRL